MKSNHKAVAPIIATLLMVAIAVVGGILIFVFTQGFFADEQVVGPTVDNIRIFGYDTANVAENDNHVGVDVDCQTNDTDANTLASGDCFTIYVRNLGDKPVSIENVIVFSETHTFGTATNDDCPSSSGFSVLTEDSPANDSIIEPNEDATICIEYSGTAVNIGKKIPVKVVTANGQTAIINLINGATSGQGAATSCTTLTIVEGTQNNDGNSYNTPLSWNSCGPGITYTLQLDCDGCQSYQTTSTSDTPNTACSLSYTFSVTASNGPSDTEFVASPCT